ncbi:hypothetical protein CE91St19_23050 [Odoribacter laneus]|jgi:hypothetical protein|uniref:DUF3244 domain-containing protein n=1 Tax=Odoribacter laneus TaxID=626933 RepID=UPI002084D07E|nr:hypothetical protein CE91St19_23050 [Odoribacter laneus]GKI26756.1 hypothetical protein CE91St20_28930 [Odoribacter laneus]
MFMKKIVLFVLFSCLVAWSYAQDDDDPPTYDEIWINVYPEPPMPTDQVPVPITVIKTASDISVMFLVQMDEVLIEFLDSKETVVLKKVVKGDPLNPVEINIEDLPNGTYTIRFTEVKASDNTYEGCFDVAGNDE